MHPDDPRKRLSKCMGDAADSLDMEMYRLANAVRALASQIENLALSVEATKVTLEIANEASKAQINKIRAIAIDMGIAVPDRTIVKRRRKMMKETK